jgi:hypothetical protein
LTADDAGGRPGFPDWLEKTIPVPRAVRTFTLVPAATRGTRCADLRGADLRARDEDHDLTAREPADVLDLHFELTLAGLGLVLRGALGPRIELAGLSPILVPPAASAVGTAR